MLLKVKYLFIALSLSICAIASGNEEVWIDGGSFYKSLKHNKQATIYFEKWSVHVDQFLKDENFYVAMQLNDSFDPLPEDGVSLPTLRTLAAMGSESLLLDYFHFLESFGRTKGINHMIMPDTSQLSGLEKNVVRLANQHSPFYFLNPQLLSYSIPDSKKEYREKSEQPRIWVADQDIDTRRIERWSQKVEDRNEFYQMLTAAKTEKFIPAYDLPNSLSTAIFSAAVVALDSKGVFPITDRSITYLGSDLKLRKRLDQYVRVYDYRVSGVPCVADIRSYQGNLEEADILIQHELQIDDFTSLVLPDIYTEDLDIEVAKMLFGARAIVGKSTHKNAGSVTNHHYLGYADLATVGIDELGMSVVDSLAREAIQKMATPGIQLAIVKDGNVVAERSYGYYTYDSLKKVSSNTVYDIASVTKVAATLPAVGYLLDRNLIQLDDSISMHLPEFANSNKSEITIKQLLAHNAGLRSYVPFWRMMMTGDRLDAFYYKTPEDEANDIRSYGIDPDPIMLDSLKSYIVQSKLIKEKESYHYSDLGFMILHLLVERKTGQRFDEFLVEKFYKPMGLEKTYFNPVKNGIVATEIAPTEYDVRYRNYQVWGEVHDRNALVFGGVAGHAGLFSTSKDLAKIMAMFLNGGYYGGRRFLSEETTTLFNKRLFPDNRRGLGWDKRDLSESQDPKAEDLSFGHTGFTGTMVWADPEEELIFVFLSNRIYPNADNWKLGELETRSNIHNAIYQAIEGQDKRNLFWQN